MDRIEVLARDRVLPATISSIRSVWTSAERGGELAHAEVQARDLVVGLAVVAEGAREVEQRRRDARRARRPRRSRRSWSRRTSRRRRRPTSPGAGRATGRRARGRSPRAGRRPRRGTARRSARISKARWPPMCTSTRGLRPVLGAAWPRSRRATRTGRRGCSRRRPAGRPPPGSASGVAMKVFDGHSTASPRTPANSSAASAPPAQRAGRDGARAVPGGPGVLEAPRHRALGPVLGVDHLVPERMQTRAIATIEADGKARELGSAGGQGAVKLPATAAAAGRHPPTNSHSAGAMRPVS